MNIYNNNNNKMCNIKVNNKMNNCICNITKEIIYKGMKVIDIDGVDCNGEICNNGDIGKDCENIINDYVEGMDEDAYENYIELGKCYYCEEEDLLYIKSKEDNKNMCFECFRVVENEKGNSLIDKDDKEDYDCGSFMIDNEYDWNGDKWVCNCEMSWCYCCESSKDNSYIVYCNKCDEGFCCNYEYIDCIDENICCSCLESYIVECKKEDICYKCEVNCLDIKNEYDIEIYKVDGELLCYDCLI